MLIPQDPSTSTPITSLPLRGGRSRVGSAEGTSSVRPGPLKETPAGLKEAPRGESTRRRLARQVGPKPNAVRGERTAERLRKHASSNGIILFFVALFMVSLFYVWANTQVVRGTYAVSELKKKHKELSAENERLKLEISTLSAPATLHQVAVGTLALVPPAADQIVMVK